jgi:hypothetical protein
MLHRGIIAALFQKPFGQLPAAGDHICADEAWIDPLRRLSREHLVE